MKSIMKIIDGNKTYIVIILAIVNGFAMSQGYVSEKMGFEIFGLLGLGGVAAFRSAMKKTETGGKK